MAALMPYISAVSMDAVVSNLTDMANPLMPTVRNWDFTGPNGTYVGLDGWTSMTDSAWPSHILMIFSGVWARFSYNGYHTIDHLQDLRLLPADNRDFRTLLVCKGLFYTIGLIVQMVSGGAAFNGLALLLSEGPTGHMATLKENWGSISAWEASILFLILLWSVYLNLRGLDQLSARRPKRSPQDTEKLLDHTDPQFPFLFKTPADLEILVEAIEAWKAYVDNWPEFVAQTMLLHIEVRDLEKARLELENLYRDYEIGCRGLIDSASGSVGDEEDEDKEVVKEKDAKTKEADAFKEALARDKEFFDERKRQNGVVDKLPVIHFKF